MASKANWKAVSITLSTSSTISLGFRHGAWFSFLHYKQFIDVIIIFITYDIIKLIMMQKPESRTVPEAN